MVETVEQINDVEKVEDIFQSLPLSSGAVSWLREVTCSTYLHQAPQPNAGFSTWKTLLYTSHLLKLLGEH